MNRFPDLKIVKEENSSDISKEIKEPRPFNSILSQK